MFAPVQLLRIWRKHWPSKKYDDLESNFTERGVKRVLHVVGPASDFISVLWYVIDVDCVLNGTPCRSSVLDSSHSVFMSLIGRCDPVWSALSRLDTTGSYADADRPPYLIFLFLKYDNSLK